MRLWECQERGLDVANELRKKDHHKGHKGHQVYFNPGKEREVINFVTLVA